MYIVDIIVHKTISKIVEGEKKKVVKNCKAQKFVKNCPEQLFIFFGVAIFQEKHSKGKERERERQRE